MRKSFATFLLLSTFAVASKTSAEVCGRYLLSVGATGPEYVALEPETLQAYARRAAVAREAEATGARLTQLAADVRAASRHVGWGGRLFGRFAAEQEALRIYAEARAAYRAERSRHPRRDIERTLTLREAILVGDLRREAATVLRQSLHVPHPRWAERLELAARPQVLTREDGFEAIVTLKTRGARRFDVYLSQSPGGFKAGVLLDKTTRARNPYYYDDFKIGTVLDGATKKRIGHTSVDQKLIALNVPMPHITRAGLAARMAASPVLRRQVHQVLRAAESAPHAARWLLTSYVEYWTRANIRDERRMVRSDLLITVLALSTVEQMTFAQALREETAGSLQDPAGFSHKPVKAWLLEARMARTRAYSEGGGDVTPLILIPHGTEDAERPALINHHDPKSESFQQLTAVLGLKTFDDPRFVSEEHDAHPDHHAMDDYVTADGGLASESAPADSGDAGAGD